MSTFDLEIQSPNHRDTDTNDLIHNVDHQYVIERYAAISWRRLRVLQLQLNGKNAIFKVIHLASKQYISITLNAFSQSEQFEFKIESNIQLIIPQRELFGLITRKNKEIFLIKQGTLEQVNDSLNAFLSQNIATLEKIYMNSRVKAVQEAS